MRRELCGCGNVATVKKKYSTDGGQIVEGEDDKGEMER